MKGHIRKRTKDSWQIVVDGGRGANGKRRQVSESVKGPKRNAQARLAQLLVELESGVYVKARKDLTVASYLNEWLNGYVAVNCAPRTQESYHFIAEKHVIPEIGNVRLVDLEPRQLQALYSKKRTSGLSTRTVRYVYSLMYQALRQAVRQGVLSRNVAEATDPPKLERKEVAVLEREDVARFLEAASDTPYFALYYVLLHTGMRRGEALGLQWRDVELSLESLGVEAYLSVARSLSKVNGRILLKEPKTKSGRRRIVLSPSCALVLRQHQSAEKELRQSLGGTLRDTDFVFSRGAGEPCDPSTVSKAFAAVVNKAGLSHMSLHALRHSHATLLLEAGVHPKIVSERLGHSSVRMTLDVYSHRVKGLQETAVLKFDELLSPQGRVGENVVKMLSDGAFQGDGKG